MNLGKIKYGYVYEIINNINGKLDDLEKEVKARGLPWIKIEGE